MDENSRPRKQARLDTFLIPRRDEKSQFICNNLYLPEVSAQESVNKSFVRYVYIIDIYQWMSVQFFYTFLTTNSDYNLFVIN